MSTENDAPEEPGKATTPASNEGTSGAQPSPQEQQAPTGQSAPTGQPAPAEQPAPTSEAPRGLEPSPGIAPPPGLPAPAAPQPPSFSAPEPQQQWQQQDPRAPQAPEAPQFGQQSGQQFGPQGGAPAAPQFGQAQAPQYAPPQQPGTVQQPAYASAPHPGAPMPPRSGMKPGALVAIILGGVLLLVAIIVGLVFWLAAIGDGKSDGGTGSAGAGTPSEAVEGFLTAVSEGDAEGALAYVESAPKSALLTDEALAASLEAAPLADIQVGEPYEGQYGQTVVDASFTLGGEPYERSFEAWDFSNGWVLTDALPRISVAVFEGHDLTLNGIAPDEDHQPLFPGTYEFELASEDFTLSGDTDVFTFVEDEDAEQMYEVTPELSEQGLETFRKLVRESLDECLAMKTLTTPCGFSVEGESTDGYEPVDGTVKRALTPEGERQLGKLEPQVAYDEPLVVSSWDTIDVDMTLEGEKDGQRAELELLWGGSMLKPTVDFGAEGGPAITWEE